MLVLSKMMLLVRQLVVQLLPRLVPILVRLLLALVQQSDLMLLAALEYEEFHECVDLQPATAV